jgi:hypothetical protein
MYQDRKVKMILRELREFGKVLRSCRANRVERAKENERILKLMRELEKPRKTAEGQESKTTSIVPEELEADLLEAVQKAISLIEDFNSQAEFERELFEKIRATLLGLHEDIFDPVKIKRLPFAGQLIVSEALDNLNNEDQNHLLENYRISVEFFKATGGENTGEGGSF